MSSAPRRTLPARPDPAQQRKLAKDLLRAWRRHDPDAISRVRAQLPDKPDIALADAQFVLAREYGFANWRELMERIETHHFELLPPVDKFKLAVKHGTAAQVRRVLTEHAEARAAINQTIFGFDSPALLAANQSPDKVRVLLEFGADPNRKSDWWAGGFHALYGASPEAAALLLAAGATPDACAAAHLDRADLLTEMVAADPSRVHERGGDGQTPLHFARSRQVVDLLLDAGADIDATDVDHRSTAAHWMLDSRAELARYLADRGATVDIFLAAALGLTRRAVELLTEDPSLLSLRTGQGDYGEKPPSSFHISLWNIGSNMTPLHTAAKFGHAGTVQAMEAFATPAQCLLLACHRGDGDTARAIVEANPGIVERLGPDDRRALTDEAWAPNPPAVRLMLELGFDPSVPSVSGPKGGNALHCAAWEGSTECVAAILEYPAGRALINVREPNWNGTPLSWCSHGSTNCGNPKADHGAVARLLIAAGAEVEPEMRDWNGSDDFQDVIEQTLRRSESDSDVAGD
jgi:ankyrin repeat protein